MKINLLFFTILFALVCTNLRATEYYVAKTGSDDNTGAADSPFLSISKAASIMVAGDICYIKEGTYRETLNPANAGTSANPITFTKFDNDKVIIDATEIIEAWSLHSGDIYKASANLTLGVELNALFHNDKALDIARWPNNVDDDKFTFDGHEVSNGSGSHVEADNIQNIDWTDGYICYLGAHSGMSWTRKITSSNSSSVNFEEVNIEKWPFNPHNPTVFRNGNRGRFYLFGALEALDHPGEWYYDEANTTVYCMLPEKENPSDEIIKVTARKNTIKLEKNYIHIDGIECFGGSVEIKGNYCQVKNGVFSNCLQSLDELDNTDAQIGNGALKVDGSNITIENNLIEYGSGNGIAILSAWAGSANHTIHNNVIRNFNTIGVHANPVRSNCPGTVVTNNTIYKCGRDGIYTSGANATVAYNDVFDCMKINNDGGVFYTVGNTGLKNSVIHHNWFHDSEGPFYADGRAAGIYLDNDSKGYDVHHNVVWNISWSGLMINWYNTDINFYNNTIWNTETAMGRWAYGHTMERIRVYNNYCDKGSENSESEESDWIGTDIDYNIVNASQPFVSAKDTNFVPNQDSYLIDAGTILEGFTDGYIGSSPDIGAYEYGGEDWVAGADWASEVVEPEEDKDSGIFTPSIKSGTIEIYPNPSSGSFTISINKIVNGPSKIDVYSSKGELVMQKTTNDASALYAEGLTFSTSLPQGIYIIKTQIKDTLYTGKLVIQ